MTALTASDGWVLLVSSPGKYRVTLDSQGPVWLSGVVTEIPNADDYSPYVLGQREDESLDFTLAAGDKLYVRARRNQTVTATALPADTNVEAVSASIAALSALFGSNADNAGDPTVFGLVKQIDANTGIPLNALTLGGEPLTLGGETLTLGA